MATGRRNRERTKRRKTVKRPRRNSPKAARHSGTLVAGLKEKITLLTRELSDSLEQQTATSEVLQVISSSPGELEPVFQMILANATRLCEAKFGTLNLYDGEVFHVAARYNVPPAFVEAGLDKDMRPHNSSAHAHVVRTKQVIHVEDLTTTPAYLERDPVVIAVADLGGARTIIIVPMLKDNELIGTMAVYRQEVRPFTDEQVGLVTNFASQAVIAIENARLLNELRDRTRDVQESLEYQTAMSDVLKVISRSRFDLQPVLDTVAETAARLCDAAYGAIFRRDGDVYRVGAAVGFSAEAIAAARHFREFLEGNPLVPGRGSVTGRVAMEGRAVHITDCASDPEYTIAEATTLGKLRTQLGVPMLRDGSLIGVIVLARHRVESFTEKQIELVTTFANQAVVAIENARLLNELRDRTAELSDSLEQQTATADVLKIISRSVFELQPVLGTLVDSAARLCQAENVQMFLRDCEVYRLAADNGFSPEYQEYVKQHPISAGRGTLVARTALDVSPVHIPDVLVDPEYTWHEGQKLGGFRAMLGVPLLRDGTCVGVMALTRAIPLPFTSKQIELATRFADQAVIAIENVRLFDESQARSRELSESLEQQTATADVLKVISRSTFNLQPVLDTLVESASRLCGAKHSMIFRYDGQVLRTAAAYNTPRELLELWERTPVQPGPGTATGRALLELRAVHIPDVLADPEYEFHEAQQVGAYRTVLAVPLLRDDTPIGTMVLWKTEIAPFTDKQIELATTFADQAVIAIENVRLFNEVQARNRELTQALEQQTASSEILRVISGSQTDVQPVFDTIVANAVRLCGARMGAVYRFDGKLMHLVAHHNYADDVLEVIRRTHPRPPQIDQVSGRAILTQSVAQIEDTFADPTYHHEMAQAGSWRSVLGVPMLHDSEPLGAIVITRNESGPFAAGHIELVKTFAEQAVIAIENVRLFDEVQRRSRELSEALEQQTATSEVLQVISSSPGDLEPVFETMLANAIRICEASFGVLFRFEDGLVHAASMHGVPPAFAEFWKRGPQRPGPKTALGRVMQTLQTVHIPDVKLDPAYVGGEPVFVAAVNLGGFRTILNVPLLKDQQLIGSFAIYRQEVKSFTDKQTRTGQQFCQTGGHRCRERTSAQRASRISAAADRNVGGTEGNQSVHFRPKESSRYAC